MYLLVNKFISLIGGFSESLTEDEKRNFSCYEIDVEACEDSCKAVVASEGNSYLVTDESEIRGLCHNDKRIFFKLEGKVLRSLTISKDAKRYAALAVEIQEHKKFLKDTDWSPVKCLELGVKISEKYPDIHQQQSQARAQINQNEQEMNQLTSTPKSR